MGHSSPPTDITMSTAEPQGLTPLQRQIVQSIRHEDWLTLTQELVVTGQPDSENPLDPDMPSGSEEKIALLVANKLRQLGLEVTLHAKQPGRPNG